MFAYSLSLSCARIRSTMYESAIIRIEDMMWCWRVFQNFARHTTSIEDFWSTRAGSFENHFAYVYILYTYITWNNTHVLQICVLVVQCFFSLRLLTFFSNLFTLPYVYTASYTRPQHGPFFCLELLKLSKKIETTRYLYLVLKSLFKVKRRIFTF